MNTQLSDLIRNTRQARKISTRELSRDVGVSPSYISGVERGVIKRPSDEVIRQVFRILGIDPSLLIYFGYSPVEVTDEDVERWIAEDQSRELLHQAYVAELSKRIEAMSVEELEYIYFVLDTCKGIMSKVWNIHNMSSDREAAMSLLREFVHFLEHKYVDVDFRLD